MSSNASLVNARARLQRLSDLKFFAGWVKDVTDAELQLRLSSGSEVAVGDDFNVEISGTDKTVVLQAKLRFHLNDELILSILSHVAKLPPEPAPRQAVDGMTGIMRYEDMDIEIAVVDVSATGAGILSPTSIPRETVVELNLATPQGSVVCQGVVRYSKPDTTADGHFRVGIQLQPMERIAKARWMKLFHVAAA